VHHVRDGLHVGILALNDASPIGPDADSCAEKYGNAKTAREGAVFEEAGAGAVRGNHRAPARLVRAC